MRENRCDWSTSVRPVEGKESVPEKYGDTPKVEEDAGVGAGGEGMRRLRGRSSSSP